MDFTRENYVCVREEKKMQKRKHIVKQKMSSSVCWFFFLKEKLHLFCDSFFLTLP